MLAELKHMFISKDLNPKSGIFNILAMVGFLVSISIFVISFFNYSTVVNLVGLIVTVGLFALFIIQRIKLESAMIAVSNSNKAKVIFLANMSHEIRTPINVVLGANELINRSSNPEEIHEYTTVIRSSGDQLLSIINNIMSITQIESGKVTPVSKPYRTDSLVSELISLGASLCDKKNLTFRTHVPKDMMSMLEGDKNNIKQIVSNFITNAVKYTEMGSVTLSAETVLLEPGIASFRIYVSDTGAGISEKELKHIFEVFRRGRNAIVSAVEGTGLGLAIAKALADALGGNLIVESKEGKGSRFGIELPQKICDDSPVGEILPSKKQKSRSNSFIAPECRILAVDDNRENLRVIEMLLERTMVTVDTAMDGLSAVDMASKTYYDLIFLDYMMPNMDGIETLQLLRKNGLSDNTPVVALTAEALSGSEEKFLSAGFNCYLSKPVSWHELEKTMINLLPADKITMSGVLENEFSEEDIMALSSKLASHDVDLESGISFLSGNLTRFCALAKIYLNGYEHNHESVRAMFDSRSDNLVFEIHSLKSASKGVGAINLYELASELEKRLNNGDFDYALNAKNLLMLEWERAANGMRILIEETSKKKTKENNTEVIDINLMEQIEKGLEGHIWLETQNAISQLLEAETDEERKQTIKYMADFVDELDFVSAQKLFNQLNKR